MKEAKWSVVEPPLKVRFKQMGRLRLLSLALCTDNILMFLLALSADKAWLGVLLRIEYLYMGKLLIAVSAGVSSMDYVCLTSNNGPLQLKR